MKLMNHVVAPVDGIVTGDPGRERRPVEYGQPLVVVDPEG